MNSEDERNWARDRHLKMTHPNKQVTEAAIRRDHGSLHPSTGMFKGSCNVCWLLDTVASLKAQLTAAEREREAFKGAFQILFNCHHGDESTCGCRDHARSLIAALPSVQQALKERS